MQLWVIIQAHAWGELQERIWLLFKESHSEEHPQLDSLINCFPSGKSEKSEGIRISKVVKKNRRRVGLQHLWF